MNLSDALARDTLTRPARVLYGAHAWKAVKVQPLDGIPRAHAGSHRHDEAAEAARIEARVNLAFDEGLAEGRRRVAAELQEQEAAIGLGFAARCDALVNELDAGLNALEGRLADQVLRLSMKLAERIACHAIQTDPTLIQSVLDDALNRLSAPWRQLDIAANPVDLPVIESWLARRDAEVVSTGATADDGARGSARVRLRPDPTLTPGGCRIVADDTQLDATVETRIQRAFEALGGSPDAR